MRAMIFASLLALLLLPTLLTGCGDSEPDTLMVSQYQVGPGKNPHVPYDPVFDDSYQDTSAKYLIQQWQSTNAQLIQQLYTDIQHLPSYPGGVGPKNCNGYWYLLTFRHGNSGLATAQLPECPASGIVIFHHHSLLADQQFYQLLWKEMNFPLVW